jgi:site-specific DNA-cytosine methylase
VYDHHPFFLIWRFGLSTYYNDIDPDACAMLKGLIKAGAIPKGFVDNRSIVDVRADEIREFTQHHFFAGIGVWAYALRRCGWPDTVPVMTGSPPCQAFSIAGKQIGFDDHRHLFPVYMKLVNDLKPIALFGEQVSSKLTVGARNKEPYDQNVEDAPCTPPMSQMFRKKMETTLLQQIENRGSNLYSTNLSYHRMPSQRLHFLLAASAHHTSVNDFGLPHSGWPTTTVRDGKGGYQGGRIRNGKYSTDTLDVTAQLAAWPDEPAHQTVLVDWLQKMRTTTHMTPAATFGEALQSVLTKHPQAVRVSASGMIWSGFSAKMATGGQLNPELSRWLMGLPKLWDEVGVQRRAAKLKGYGNAIVSQVAEAVIRAFMVTNGLTKPLK